MKSVLIDSDILIEVLRARDAAILARWDQLSRVGTPLFCSPVTVAELFTDHIAQQKSLPVVRIASKQLGPLSFRAIDLLEPFFTTRLDFVLP